MSDQAWIPCENRLPPDNVVVLVTIKKKPMGLECVTVSYREHGEWYWLKDQQVIDDFDVLAWMHFPKPYKSEVLLQ